MITNDYTDLFMLPISNLINNQIWSVIENSRLLLIPFIITIVYLANKCRSQGVDEGAPAIQCYKQVESKFISMLVVILLACKCMPSMPVDIDNIKVKQMTCSSDGLGLFTSKNIYELKGSSFLNSIPLGYSSLWQGVMNQFSIGMTNAGIGAMPCNHQVDLNGNAVSYRKAALKVSSYKPEDPKLKELAVQFNLQCYRNALDRVSVLERSNNMKFKTITFNSFEMKKVYEANQEYSKPLMLNVKKSVWGNADSGWFDGDVTVSCSSAANEIYKRIGSDIFKSKDYTYFKAINLNGTNKDDEYVNTVYGNILRDSSKNNDIYSFSTIFSQKTIEGFNEFLSVALDKQKIRDSLSASALRIDSFFSSGTTYQFQIISPTVISVVKACLIVALPLILLFSGFSSRVLLICSIGYFSIDFTRCLLEFGVIFDEMLMSIKDSILSSNKSLISDLAGSVIDNLAIIANYAMSAVWFALVGLTGLKLTTSMNLASQTSESTSKGAGQAASVAASVATKGVL